MARVLTAPLFSTNKTKLVRRLQQAPRETTQVYALRHAVLWTVETASGRVPRRAATAGLAWVVQFHAEDAESLLALFTHHFLVSPH